MPLVAPTDGGSAAASAYAQLVDAELARARRGADDRVWATLRPALDGARSQRTRAPLADALACRAGPCALGALLADAMCARFATGRPPNAPPDRPRALFSALSLSLSLSLSRERAPEYLAHKQRFPRGEGKHKNQDEFRPLVALLESGSVRGRLSWGAFGSEEAARLLPWANEYAVLRFADGARALDAFSHTQSRVSSTSQSARERETPLESCRPSRAR